MAAATTDEVCGGLYGYVSGDIGTAVALTRVLNISDDPLQFRLSLDGLSNACADARADNPDIDGLVAVFHSHPTGSAEPSLLDPRAMQAYPTPWLIYTSPTAFADPGNVRCFVPHRTVLREIPVVERQNASPSDNNELPVTR